MRDIFISSQAQFLSSWSAAFPKAELSKVVVQANKTQASKAVVFWLHMQPDCQEWLKNNIEKILESYSQAKIIVLANVPEDAEALYVLKLGAHGYSHAYVDAPVLKEIKTVVNHGGLWIGQALLQRLILVTTQLTGNPPAVVENLLEKLTKREQQVALEASKGLSNKEIARVLAITERTVKAHLAAAFLALGAKDRLQLALMLTNNQNKRTVH